MKTTRHVPVTKGNSDSFGGTEWIVEHMDGTKKVFYAEEGEHEAVKKEAEQYRKENF